MLHTKNHTKKTPVNHDYILHGHILQTETATKYLCITIQSDLKWNKHVDNRTANANRQLNFLKRNLKESSKHIKERAYMSVVRPKLEYSSCGLDPHNKNQNNQIEMVQRRAARYTCNRYHNTNSVSNILEHLQYNGLHYNWDEYRRD